MVYLPQPAFCNIMSFLHREYDYERQQDSQILTR